MYFKLNNWLVVFVQGKLDKLLDTSGYTAVYWYARNCKRSEIILKGIFAIICIL